MSDKNVQDIYPLSPAQQSMLGGLPAHPERQGGAACPAGSRKTAAENGAIFVAPRTPLEEEIAQACRDVLKVDRVGVGDRFWEPGGHSRLMPHVCSRIGKIFGVDLPLQTLSHRQSLACEGEDIDAALVDVNEMSEDEIRAPIEREARELERME